MNTDFARRQMLRALASTAMGSVLIGGCALSRGAAGSAFDADAGRPLGIQLYMLGDDAFRDPQASFARLAGIGYREVELPQVPAKDVAAFAAAASASGITLASLHLGSGRLVPKGRISLDSEAAEIAEAMGTLGVRQAVLSLPPVPDNARFGGGRPFGTVLQEAIASAGADYWMRLAERLNRCAAALAPHGIALGYHNHNIEFAPVDAGTGFDLLVRHSDPRLVHFELDIGWIASAGLDPAAMIGALGGRVRQLHLKDVAAGTPANFVLETRPAVIGAGAVDWHAVMVAARRAGVRHAYVEQQPPFALSRIEAARQSFDYLAALRLEPAESWPISECRKKCSCAAMTSIPAATSSSHRRTARK